MTSLGICSLPLWPLGLLWRILGMGPGAGYVRPYTLLHLVTWFGGRGWGVGIGFGGGYGLWLVPAGLRRTLLSLVSLQPRILRPSEHQQHANHEYLQLLRPGW